MTHLKMTQLKIPPWLCIHRLSQQLPETE